MKHITVNLKTGFTICLTWMSITFAGMTQGVVWTHWNSIGSNSVSGLLGGVNVTYSGEVDPSTTINNLGTYFWTPDATFTNSLTPLSPDTSDMIRLGGGLGITSILTFASPVTNLIIDVASLGSINNHTTSSYDFDQAFSILSQGGDYWHPNGAGCSLTVSGNSLYGLEGSGCILFSGPITSLSWTVPVYEFYSGFTAGTLVVSAVPEPTSSVLVGLGGLSLFIFRFRK